MVASCVHGSEISNLCEAKISRITAYEQVRSIQSQPRIEMLSNFHYRPT